MSKPYVVGIDIGGTNTVFGIVDARGSILATGSIKTQKYTEITDYVNALHEELSRLLAQENVTDQIAGIGIGAPNGNYFNGTIEFAPNLPWKGVIPLAQMVREKFNIPVTITNDANAAAIGEMTYGAARGVKDFIMITLGTGVGSGIVINGQMVYGHDGFAGELGHVIVRRGNGRLCGCGRTGCLEAYTSATGVARTAREFLELRNDESTLRQLPIQEITSKDVYDAAVWRQTISGDFRIYRYNLRRGIRRLHRIFKPQDDCPVRRIGKIGRTDHASYTRSYGKKSAGHLQRESKTGTFGIERERCRRIGSQCSGLGSQLIGIRYIKKKRAAMQPFSFSINLFITPAKPCA